MAEDAEQAMGVAASGDVQFAQYSSNIICLDEDLDRLHENTRLVMKKIQNLGFACRLETINAVDAWRGTLPGDGYCNVRRVLLHTLNLADLPSDHLGLGGSPREPIAVNAEEEPAAAVCGNHRRNTVPGEPPRVGPRSHANVRTVRCWQVYGTRADRRPVVPVDQK